MLPDLAAFDLLPAQIAVLDETGAIVSTNRAWDDVAEQGALGRGNAGWNYLDVCRAAAAEGCAEAGKMAQGISLVLGGVSPGWSCVYPCAYGGQHHWFQATVSPMPRGAQTGAVVMHVDVTALERDPLTELANRVLFDAQAALSLSEAMQQGSTMGVLMLDLNQFKPVNDRFGHLAGDHVLRTVAARLRRCVRAEDMAARFGGDEFGVVLAPGTRPNAAVRIMHRIQSQVEQPVSYDGQCLGIHLSIGTGMYPADGSTIDSLVAAADARMYEMKRQRMIA
jgi:diguanylate cyclase (GGDEF)-like protein